MSPPTFKAGDRIVVIDAGELQGYWNGMVGTVLDDTKPHRVFFEDTGRYEVLHPDEMQLLVQPSAGQSRKASVIEAVANIAIGMAVALVSQYVVFPLVGIKGVTATQHVQITVAFTAISFARSYFVRRWFNQLFVKGELA